MFIKKKKIFPKESWNGYCPPPSYAPADEFIQIQRSDILEYFKLKNKKNNPADTNYKNQWLQTCTDMKIQFLCNQYFGLTWWQILLFNYKYINLSLKKPSCVHIYKLVHCLNMKKWMKKEKNRCQNCSQNHSHERGERGDTVRLTKIYTYSKNTCCESKADAPSCPYWCQQALSNT